MKFKIKDTEFISTETAVNSYLDYLNNNNNDKVTKIKQLIRGNENKYLITAEDEFDLKEFFIIEASNYNDYLDYLKHTFAYYVLTNSKFGDIVVREDNVDEIEEIADIFNRYGIKKLIRSANKQTTVLLMEDGTKYITKKDTLDRNDIEKAVMILLLKQSGYNINDIYSMIDSVR